MDYIYSSEPGRLIGFHGCSAKLRDDVISGKTSLFPSKNPWDWLGSGIYFWQNNYDRAWDYACNPPKNVKIKNPAVIGAIFSLGNCLDFTEKKWINSVKYSYNILKDSFKSKEKEMPVNTNPIEDTSSRDRVIRRLDCAVISNLHAEFALEGFPPFDSVRAVFFEGEPLYPTAGFFEKTHIQVCIRNPNCIEGYFMPRKETVWPLNNQEDVSKINLKALRIK